MSDMWPEVKPKRVINIKFVESVSKHYIVVNDGQIKWKFKI